jgi:transposase
MRIAVLGILGMCVLAAILYWASRKRAPRRANAATLFRQLVVAARDTAVAERLVEQQRQRDPEASDITLVRRALEELRADLRR